MSIQSRLTTNEPFPLIEELTQAQREEKHRREQESMAHRPGACKILQDGSAYIATRGGAWKRVTP